MGVRSDRGSLACRWRRCPAPAAWKQADLRQIDVKKTLPRPDIHGYDPQMSKAEILAELPGLKAEELAEVQAKLDELVGEAWTDAGQLSDSDKTALDAALADYRTNPDEGSSWEQVSARIQAKLRP